MPLAWGQPRRKITFEFPDGFKKLRHTNCDLFRELAIDAACSVTESTAVFSSLNKAWHKLDRLTLWCLWRPSPPCSLWMAVVSPPYRCLPNYSFSFKVSRSPTFWNQFVQSAKEEILLSFSAWLDVIFSCGQTRFSFGILDFAKGHFREVVLLLSLNMERSLCNFRNVCVLMMVIMIFCPLRHLFLRWTPRLFRHRQSVWIIF